MCERRKHHTSAAIFDGMIAKFFWGDTPENTKSILSPRRRGCGNRRHFGEMIARAGGVS
jgi:hypothetical protein